MKPAPFEYLRPDSLEETIGLLARHGERAKVIAGGQSLVPMMNFRFAKPEILVDINDLKGLDYCRVDGGLLRIGALARHAALHGSAAVREACPLMSEAYQHVAHGAVRNRGTLCGSLCHADPAAEMPAVALACGASMALRSAAGERIVPAAEFLQGLYATAANADELLVEVRIPVAGPGVGHGFQEVSARQGDFALTLVASLIAIDGGRIAKAALVYGGVSDRPIRLAALEQRLLGQAPSPALFAGVADAAAEAIDVNEDVHGDREYRRDLIRSLTPRVLAQATRRAQARGAN